jgi:NAD(P)-dependent dehydrogenase (short-subunit alcohol dehydrogenase family)
MSKIAVVTGASSGVGRWIAIKLAQQGWSVAAVARREDDLRETAKLAGEAGGRIMAIPCDVADAKAIDAMARTVREKLGAVEVLVNAAGTNTPDRSLKVLSLETYRKVTEINLTGSYLCVQAFLPGMRERRSGTIINIVSDAAIQASPKAGAAYVVSKFGMRGLTQSINAEERPNGIRATAIFPGDIDTPLLKQRPTPPTDEQRKLMMQPEDIADCAMLAINLPRRAVVEELLVRPG